MTLVLAAENVITDPSQWVQYGIGGLLIVAAMFGFIWFKPAVDRLLRDKDSIEKQRDSLIDVNQKETLPTLRESSEAARRMADALVVFTAEMRSMRETLERAERADKDRRT